MANTTSKKRGRPSKADKEIQQLKEQVALLEKENKQLKESKNTLVSTPKMNKPSFTGFLRSTGVAFFVTLSIVTFLLFNISSWVRATILDTDTFVETTTPLLLQPAVQKTLQDEISEALFENVDVEARLVQILPEDIKFLAGPLAGQIESFTYEKIGEILASEELEIVWTSSLETVHETLIIYIENEQNDGVLNINDVYDFTSEQLQDTSLAFLLNRNLPDAIGQFTLAEIAVLDEVRTYATYLERLPVVMLITSLISFLLALLLAARKRDTLITMVILSIVILISTLLAVKIGEVVTTDSVEPRYADASMQIYNTLTEPLVERTQGYLAVFGVLGLILIITNRSKKYQDAKAYSANKVQELANRYVPTFDRPSWSAWIINNQTVLLWVAFTVSLIAFGLRIPPDTNQVLNGLVIGGVASLVAYIIIVILKTSKK